MNNLNKTPNAILGPVSTKEIRLNVKVNIRRKKSILAMNPVDDQETMSH